MTEATNALDDDEVAGLEVGVSKRVVRCDTRTQQRGRIGCGEIVRHRRNRLCRDGGVLGVAPVERQSGNISVLAFEERTAPARLTGEAVATVPASPDKLAFSPLGDVVADRINIAGHLMAGDTGIVQLWVAALLDKGIAVTDATGLDRDPYLVGCGCRNLPLNKFKISTSSRNNSCLHCLRHSVHSV